jgi:hypothetical protein
VTGTPIHAQTRVVLAAMAAALLVLVLGVTAALTHDEDNDKRAPTSRSVTTVPPTTSRGATSTSTSRPRTTLPTASTTTTSLTSTTSPSTTLRGIPGTTTPVRATVGSPEAAANGLIAAYRNDDRALAGRFATDAVVDVLFQQPYQQADDPGFQGCRPDGGDFLCTYLQPTVRYDMTARGSAGGEFEIIAIDVRET